MGCRAREHWAIRLSPALTEAPAPRYRVVPNRSGLAPGVDPLKLSQLNDQLEVEDFAGLSAG